MKRKNTNKQTLNKTNKSVEAELSLLCKQWKDFSNYLMTENRFIVNDAHKKFVNFIKKSANNRRKTLNKGESFWRARIGSGPIEKCGDIVNNPIAIEEMGAPSAEQCIPGRANCEGIPHLYLSDKWETALAEIRPHINAYVTLCEFKLKTDISIVDLFFDNFIFRGKRKKSEYLFWLMTIRRYFSVPINPSDKQIWFVSTQYLTELFKSEGYDGIKYRSSQRQHGFNIVLFNPKKAERIRIEEEKVHNIEYITDHMYEAKKRMRQV